MGNKISASDRRNEIKELIAEKGIFTINKSALGRKYGVSDVMIRKDIDIILKEIPEEKIEHMAFQIQYHFKHALKVADSLLDNKNDNIRLKAVDKLTQAIERFNRFLEAYGKKPITPNKLDVNNGISVFKYNELVNDYNALLDDYTEFYEGIGKAINNDIMEVNRKFLSFKLEKITLALFIINEGIAAALNAMVEDKKITGEEANEYYHQFEEETVSLFTKYLKSKGCKKWLNEPIILYDKKDGTKSSQIIS